MTRMFCLDYDVHLKFPVYGLLLIYPIDMTGT